jgi:phage-related protein
MANPSTRQNKEDRPSGVGQMASDLGRRAQDAGSHLAEKAKDTASSLADKAKDTASSVASQARDAASSVARTAGNVASSLGERADDATSSVGGGMKTLAGTLREKAPQGGMMGTAASSVADALETGGRYLQEHGLSDIGSDMVNLIRRNPIPAVLVGFGIGFLFARATRS